MDTGKTELKILTDALLNVLEAHTKAIADGLDGRKLQHTSIINGLMKKIQDYQHKAAPQPTAINPSTQPIEVLHGAPTDISPLNQAEVEPENRPEGAKVRSNDMRPDFITPEKAPETPNTIVPTTSPTTTPTNWEETQASKATQQVLQAVQKPISPAQQPNVPLGTEVTPENIDDFAALMGDDSLVEPEIKGVKN